MTSPMGQRPFVLVIKNELLQTMMLTDLIEEAGCDAIVATRIKTAIRILGERTDIRVVVADLDVRGSVAELKLAALIRDRWPPIELILTVAVKPEISSMRAKGVFHDKPFSYGRLVRSIRKFAALDQ